MQVLSTKRAVWRNLTCTGSFPSPRYRHTSTVLAAPTGTSKEGVLVIIGGIGEGNKALGDLYVLDFGTLAWSSPTTPTGDPVPPVYGHCSFASKNEKSINDCMFVFGGSLDAASVTEKLLHGLYQYDLVKNQWTVVRTGFQFPNLRSNHSACRVEGWAPVNNLPEDSAGEGGSTASSSASRSATFHSSEKCVVIFGGINSISSMADTWALDLSWKEPGLSQFTTSQAAQLDTQMLAASLDNSTDDSNGKSTTFLRDRGKSIAVVNSASVKSLLNSSYANNQFMDTAASLNFKTPHGGFSSSHSNNSQQPPNDDVDLSDIGLALMQLRKEKALAEIQLIQERKKSNRLENENRRLSDDLLSIQRNNEATTNDHETAITELRQALVASVARCSNLERLNEEAYSLLMLQSMHYESSSSAFDMIRASLQSP